MGENSCDADARRLVFRFGDFMMSEVRFSVDQSPYGRHVALDTPHETFSLDASQCRELDSWLHGVFPGLGNAPMDARHVWGVRCVDPAAKLVLVALVCQLDSIDSGGRVDVSLSDLAEKTELGMEYVVEALAVLRSLRLIRPAAHGHGMDGELMSIEINPEVLS